uniref:Transmembrane protein n=1 Tax=Medicago truncatula TaxID=3880 RepID=A2Q615_MEDTR|nr:hypothetical protein MtrDRAFT_AC172742g33v1 [Medicago truncatula]
MNNQLLLSNYLNNNFRRLSWLSGAYGSEVTKSSGAILIQAIVCMYIYGMQNLIVMAAVRANEGRSEEEELSNNGSFKHEQSRWRKS